MRDWKLNVVENDGVDIDIIDGAPAYLDYDTQTTDQRAAVAAYQVKGTIPGNLDFGVSWADEYTQGNTVSQLNNEIQQQIQICAGTANAGRTMTTASQYGAVMLSQGGSVGVLITRGS